MDGFIQCCVSLQLISGPHILPQRKRINRIWSKIEQTNDAIREEFPEESEEYILLLEQYGYRHIAGSKPHERMRELEQLWDEHFRETSQQHDGLMELIDSFPVLCYLDLHKYMAEDMFAAEFPFDAFVDEFFDVNNLLWPDNARLLLDKVDTEKLFYFPDLIPIYFFLRKCAEERHVIKMSYED